MVELIMFLNLNFSLEKGETESEFVELINSHSVLSTETLNLLLEDKWLNDEVCIIWLMYTFVSKLNLYLFTKMFYAIFYAQDILEKLYL
jgi:hypothetical protein